MRIHDSPCDRDCPDRTFDPNCHGTCKRYKDWLAEEKRKQKGKRMQSDWTQSKSDLQSRSSRYHQKKDRGII